MQYDVLTGPIQNDAAPFSPEMVQGSHPDSPRLPFAAKAGAAIVPIAVTPFPFEVFSSWHPDSPRLPFVAKQGLQIAETTPVAAPFSPEMVQGWHPDRSVPVWAHPGSPINFVDVAVFTFEVIEGWHPDTPRLPFSAKQGLSIAETTPVAAPFSPEMVQGLRPLDRVWRSVPGLLGNWISDLNPISATIITLRGTAGATYTTTCIGVAGPIYCIGPPQLYTGTNFSPQQPGRYLGFYILETLIGVDGHAWYRWDHDAPADDTVAILTAYSTGFSA